MKRIGICIFYDEEGVADNFFYYLLDSLDSIVQKLIVIVNGEMQPKYVEKIRNRNILVALRDNVGFDSGAYKFAIDLFSDIIFQYDELLLFNDTFFGPFFSWNIVFNKMLGCDADFWAMSRHPGGTLGEDFVFQSHLQSYFIVVRGKMLYSDEFRTYWDELSIPHTRMEATLFFELTFTRYFEKRGFKSTSYLEVCGFEGNYNVNPYDNEFTQLLTKNYDFPLVKRQHFSLRYVNDLEKLFDYINAFSEYPVKYITEYLERINRINMLNKKYVVGSLRDFCRNHNKVYVFGNGKYSKIIVFYLNSIGIKDIAIVTSKRDMSCNNNIELNKLKLDSEDGIILAVNRKLQLELLNNEFSKFPSDSVYW